MNDKLDESLFEDVPFEGNTQDSLFEDVPFSEQEDIQEQQAVQEIQQEKVRAVAEEISPVETFIATGINSALFETGDEIKAGLETGFGFFGDYDAALQENRAYLQAAEEQNPKAATAGLVTGAIASGIATGGALGAAGLLSKGKTLANAVKIGTLEGSLTGWGASEEEKFKDQLYDGLEGAAIGGAAGGFFDVGGKALKSTSRFIPQNIKDTSELLIDRAAGIYNKTLKRQFDNVIDRIGGTREEFYGRIQDLKFRDGKNVLDFSKNRVDIAEDFRLKRKELGKDYEDIYSTADEFIPEGFSLSEIADELNLRFSFDDDIQKELLNPENTAIIENIQKAQNYIESIGYVNGKPRQGNISLSGIETKRKALVTNFSQSNRRSGITDYKKLTDVEQKLERHYKEIIKDKIKDIPQSKISGIAGEGADSAAIKGNLKDLLEETDKSFQVTHEYYTLAKETANFDKASGAGLLFEFISKNNTFLGLSAAGGAFDAGDGDFLRGAGLFGLALSARTAARNPNVLRSLGKAGKKLLDNNIVKTSADAGRLLNKYADQLLQNPKDAVTKAARLGIGSGRLSIQQYQSNTVDEIMRMEGYIPTEEEKAAKIEEIKARAPQTGVRKALKDMDIVNQQNLDPDKLPQEPQGEQPFFRELKARPRGENGRKLQDEDRTIELPSFDLSDPSIIPIKPEGFEDF